MTEKQRDAFISWVNHGNICKTCRNTGYVYVGRPVIYETDTAEERMDAWDSIKRRCPDCPDFKAVAEWLTRYCGGRCGGLQVTGTPGSGAGEVTRG